MDCLGFSQESHPLLVWDPIAESPSQGSRAFLLDHSVADLQEAILLGKPVKAKETKVLSESSIEKGPQREFWRCLSPHCVIALHPESSYPEM